MITSLLLLFVLLCLPTSISLAPCSIIGGGRIGSLLASSFPSTSLIYTRTASLDDLSPGPIYITTCNDALIDVLERVPNDRHADLVFLQVKFAHSQSALCSASLCTPPPPLLFTRLFNPERLHQVLPPKPQSLRQHSSSVVLRETDTPISAH